jgi:hypothetical protein
MSLQKPIFGFSIQVGGGKPAQAQWIEYLHAAMTAYLFTCPLEDP